MKKEEMRYNVIVETREDRDKLYSVCKSLIHPSSGRTYMGRVMETKGNFMEGEELAGFTFTTNKTKRAKLLLTTFLDKICWYEVIAL